MKRPKAPCLSCEHRSETCHSECGIYNDYVEKQKAYREHITKQRVQDNALQEIEEKRYKKP